MSHDDFYPSGFIPKLVSCLQAEPDILLAYPRCVLVDMDERPLSIDLKPELLLKPEEEWSTRGALRQLILRQPIQIKGMFRLKRIVHAGLYVRSPLETVLADVCWVFALGLLGQPRFVPSAHLLKRNDPMSASAGWTPEFRHVWSVYLVLCSYIRDFSPDFRAAAEATAVVSAWSTARMIAVAPKSWPVPLRGRALARKLLARALRAPIGPSGLP
jgi:hypothetical protein